MYLYIDLFQDIMQVHIYSLTLLLIFICIILAVKSNQNKKEDNKRWTYKSTCQCKEMLRQIMCLCKYVAHCHIDCFTRCMLRVCSVFVYWICHPLPSHAIYASGGEKKVGHCTDRPNIRISYKKKKENMRNWKTRSKSVGKKNRTNREEKKSHLLNKGQM